LHVVLHFVEDRGLDEVSAFPPAPASGEKLSPTLGAAVDVAHDTVELLLADLRALRGRRVEWIAHLLLAGPGKHALDELVVNLRVDEQHRGRGAALALEPEEPEKRALDRGVEIGIGQDDVRALAAQLQ